MNQTPLTIFLSPHFDDIALSCGAIAARLSRMGSRSISIVVFAAPAPEGVDLSPFALGMHAQWERDAGASLQAINEIRRGEEQAAARLLGLELVPGALDGARGLLRAAGRPRQTAIAASAA